MFQNLMLPLDGSPYSERALPLAIQIARAAGARLHVVRVYTDMAPASLPALPGADALLRDQARAHLAAAAARAQAQGVMTCHELLEGPVVPALETYSTATGIDLVVMTTQGRTGLSRAVLGSVAERFVRTSMVPVLLLNPRAITRMTTPATTHIMVALDGTPEAECTIEPALALALLWGARVTVARIAVAPFDIAATLGPRALDEYYARAAEQARGYLQEVADRLCESGVRIDVMARAADRATTGILQCAADAGADLIVMATSGRSGWARIAIGSVAESVLHKADLPILMMRPASLAGRARTVPAGAAPEAALR